MTKTRHYSHLPNNDVPHARFVGIDEAGYGPNLGPLVLCCVAFRGPLFLREQCWWETLAPTVSRAKKRAPFWVDDSKKVLASTNGLKRLGDTVLSFLHLRGCSDHRLESLMCQFDSGGDVPLRQEHWHEPQPAESKLTTAEIVASLIDPLWQCGLELIDVRFKTLFPSEFNQLLQSEKNKAAVELAVVRELLAPHLCESVAEDTYVTVDRLGGRRYYRSVLEDLAGTTFLQTIDEAPDISSYRFQMEQREAEISFEVKADGRHFPVALASMIAKYVRERCMEQFNSFWARRIPGLAPTAGYPVDAKRFYQSVSSSLHELGIPANAFWRDK